MVDMSSISIGDIPELDKVQNESNIDDQSISSSNDESEDESDENNENKQ